MWKQVLKNFGKKQVFPEWKKCSLHAYSKKVFIPLNVLKSLLIPISVDNKPHLIIVQGTDHILFSNYYRVNRLGAVSLSSPSKSLINIRL